MQGAIILTVLMVILFIAAAVLPAFSGLLVIAGLGVGLFLFLVGLNLSSRK